MAVPIWEVQLNGPPAVPLAGLGCHGRAPRSAKYCLPDVWCVHLYKYHGTLVINGSSFRVEPGMVSVIPPLVHFEHRWERFPSVHVFAWFIPARIAPDESRKSRRSAIPACFNRSVTSGRSISIGSKTRSRKSGPRSRRGPRPSCGACCGILCRRRPSGSPPGRSIQASPGSSN